MRRVLLLALLITVPAPGWTAQQGDSCDGGLWRKVEAMITPETTFADTVTFLRERSIHYRIFDARAASLFVNGELVPNLEPYGATDCQPREKAPNCSIVFKSRFREASLLSPRCQIWRTLSELTSSHLLTSMLRGNLSAMNAGSS